MYQVEVLWLRLLILKFVLTATSDQPTNNPDTEFKNPLCQTITNHYRIIFIFEKVCFVCFHQNKAVWAPAILLVHIFPTNYTNYPISQASSVPECHEMSPLGRDTGLMDTWSQSTKMHLYYCYHILTTTADHMVGRCVSRMEGWVSVQVLYISRLGVVGVLQSSAFNFNFGWG